MISYELPMALALAAPLLMVNTLSLREMVDTQNGFVFGILPRWTILQWPFPQVFSFIVFLICAFAETNRVPFDLPEAENELVAGFHTEYSSHVVRRVLHGGVREHDHRHIDGHAALPRRLASDLSDANTVRGSFRCCCSSAAGLVSIFHGLNPARPLDRITLPVFGIIFIGLGLVFAVPFLQPYVLPLFWFCGKTGFLLFIFIWIRGTLPRFRYDQLMAFAWKFMFPVALLIC